MLFQVVITGITGITGITHNRRGKQRAGYNCQTVCASIDFEFAEPTFDLTIRSTSLFL